MAIVPCLCRDFTGPAGIPISAVRDDSHLLLSGGGRDVRALVATNVLVTTSGFFVATCRVLCVSGAPFAKTCVPTLEWKAVTGRGVSAWRCRTNETVPTMKRAPSTRYDSNFWGFHAAWIGLCVLMSCIS